MRHELGSVGFDDFLALVGGDPEGSDNATGLRVPALPGVRYLFLGATCELNAGDRVQGFRQLVTIASPFPSGTGDLGAIAPILPFEIAVTSPTWHFIDGFVSWHFTTEPKHLTQAIAGPFDQESFVFEDSGSPGLLYETAHFPALPTAPGYLGLDGYSPPGLRGDVQLVARDIRYPWQENDFFALDYVADRKMRARVYIAVLQTNPATRFEPDLSTLAAFPQQAFVNSAAREDVFIQAFRQSVVYWRVGASLIVDRANPTGRR